MWRLSLASCIAGVVVAAGCSRGAPPLQVAPVDRRADVSRLMQAGCYACLREALALVDEGHAAERRFDLLALLASRVRELGFRDAVDWRARAEAAARADDGRAELILTVIDQTPQPQGGRVYDQPVLTHDGRERLGTRASSLWPAPPADPVDAFFHLTLRCHGLVRPDPSEAEVDSPSDAALVRYRQATCGRVDADALAGVLAAEPRFVEVHYFSALAALGRGSLLTTERALDLFEPHFPGATAATFLRGQVLLALEEFEPAAARFARVLAVMPSMPEALLYHMRAESHVDPMRGEAAADRLVTLGTWYQGEAYYWRAWNRRALKRLAEAAADIETAKRVLFNAAVPKLAGFIAYDRDDLRLAEAELVESLGRNDADCEVQFALGQVLMRTRRWSEAAARFVATAGCARAAQAAISARLAEISAAPLEPARRQRLAARAERDRATERAREGLATLTAASGFVLAGRPTDARRLAETAAGWPELQEKAGALLDRLPR